MQEGRRAGGADVIVVVLGAKKFLFAGMNCEGVYVNIALIYNPFYTRRLC